MPTKNQLMRSARKTPQKKLGIKDAPQYSGTIQKVLTMTPKKPNSALRKVVVVRSPLNYRVKRTVSGICIHKMKNKTQIVKLPGEAVQTIKNQKIFFVKRNTKDLPSVRRTAVLGRGELKGLTERRQGRSKYGTRQPKK